MLLSLQYLCYSDMRFRIGQFFTCSIS